MLAIQASDSAADALAVKAYLRVLASNPELKTPTKLNQAAIYECVDLLCYTPEELAERAHGLLK